jgi:hypothetical protein
MAWSYDDVIALPAEVFDVLVEELKRERGTPADPQDQPWP